MIGDNLGDRLGYRRGDRLGDRRGDRLWDRRGDRRVQTLYPFAENWLYVFALSLEPKWALFLSILLFYGRGGGGYPSRNQDSLR